MSISAARQAGLHVPEDLSVVGYDDIEVADYVGLTTVRQQLFESGRLGAEMLLAEVRSRSTTPPSIVLPPEVVVRGHHGTTEGGTSIALSPVRCRSTVDALEEVWNMFEHRGRRARAWVSALAVTAIVATAAPLSVAAQGEAPSCGTEPVELLVYFESGFPFQQALAEEFTKQFPNVTWNIREDQFANLMTQTPRLLAGDNPPDLIRLPTMVDLVRDGLLLNLEPYVEAFGWDQWPASLLTPHRVAEGGRPRGEGDLYAGGLNKATTGVFYNKEQAAQIGMTEPPATLAEFEELLAKAKEAGLLPIMQWNTVNSGGGLAFPLQNLMAALGPTQPINEWILPEGGRHGRYAHQPGSGPAPRSNGSRRATSPRTSMPSSTPTRTRALLRARASSPSTVTGRMAASTPTPRAISGSSCSRRPKKAACTARWASR